MLFCIVTTQKLRIQNGIQTSFGKMFDFTSGNKKISTQIFCIHGSLYCIGIRAGPIARIFKSDSGIIYNKNYALEFLEFVAVHYTLFYHYIWHWTRMCDMQEVSL